MQMSRGAGHGMGVGAYHYTVRKWLHRQRAIYGSAREGEAAQARQAGGIAGRRETAGGASSRLIIAESLAGPSRTHWAR